MAAVILPNVASVAKVVMKGSHGGHSFVNTWYMKYGSFPTDQAGANNAAAIMAATYWTAFANRLSTGASHVQTQLIDLASRQGLVGVDSAQHLGTKVCPAPLPNSVACCISFVIQDRYRGGHPRMYLPAADQTDIINGNTWEPTTLGAYQSDANNFHTQLNGLTVGGTTWQHVVVRYYSQTLLLTTPLVRPIAGTKVGSRVDTMRRRLGKETT